jgi:hypothetical protein
MFASRFNSDFKKAQNFIECLKFIQLEYTNFPLNEVWNKIDNKSLDERDKYIKAQKRKVKRKDAKFKPDGLKRPKRIELARDDYRCLMKEKNDNYSNDRFVKWYAALSDKEKDKYEKLFIKASKEYQVEYDKQFKTAIENGDYPEPKPKQPPTAYFLFTSVCRAGNSKYISKKDIERGKDMKEIERTKEIYGPLWNNFKTNKKGFDTFMEVVNNLKVIYKHRLYERNVRVLERLISKGVRDSTDVEGFKEELVDVKQGEPEKVDESKLKLSL